MKSKIIYPIVALFFATQNIVAQNKISGNIKDEQTKEFITSVSIYISDLMEIQPLNAENLADVAYQSHLSRLKYAPQNPLTGRNGVYNMGRNINLKLIFNL